MRRWVSGSELVVQVAGVFVPGVWQVATGHARTLLGAGILLGLFTITRADIGMVVILCSIYGEADKAYLTPAALLFYGPTLAFLSNLPLENLLR